MAAVAADVDAHVFDHAKHRDVDFAEHFDAFLAVQQGDVLGCGDDDGAGYRDFLGQGELDVAGAGGHVDNEVVEFVPEGLLQQLHHGAADHGAAPDHGGFLGDDEGHGVGLESVGVHGDEVFVFAGIRAFTFRHAEHHADAGAVDVGVEDADPCTFGLESQSQVDGGGGFADTALAGGDGDDVFHAGDRGQVFLDFVGVDFLAHVDVHVLDTIDVFQGVTDQLFQGACDAFRGVWQLDHEGNVPVVVGIEGFNGTQFVEVLVEVGIAVLANRCLQGLL